MLILILVMELVVILIWVWYKSSQRSEVEEEWVAKRGGLITEQETHGIGRGRAFFDENPEVLRVDLGEYGFGGSYGVSFYRLRIHLAFPSSFYFEMTGRFSEGLGKVFEKGEGEIGVESVDRYFWTETPMREQVADLFRDQTLLHALAQVSWLYSLSVMGNRIELVFKRDPKLLNPMYDLAQRLTEAFLKKA